MDYQPLFDKILVKENNEKQMQGILVISSSAGGFKKGIAVAVGPGKPNEPLGLKVGDTLLYKQIDAVDIQVDGEDYKIIQEERVWMVKPE